MTVGRPATNGWHRPGICGSIRSGYRRCHGQREMHPIGYPFNSSLPAGRRQAQDLHNHRTLRSNALTASVPGLAAHCGQAVTVGSDTIDAPNDIPLVIPWGSVCNVAPLMIF